jgi:hypothetical protein
MLHVSTQPCYLGWYLPLADGQTQIGLTPDRFSAADIEAYNQAVAVIGDMRPILIDYLALEADYEALQAIGPELRERFGGGPLTLVGVDMVMVQTGVQRALSNFLQAARAFVDRTQTRLSQDGHNARPSPAWQRFANVEKAAFEQSLGVRILTLLSRYIRHYEAPVTLVPISDGEDGDIHIEMRLILGVETLLGFDGLDGRLRAELLSLRDKRLDLMALAEAFMAAHGAMMLSLIHNRAGELFALEQFEARIAEQCKPPEGAIPIIWEGPQPTDGKLDGSAYHFCFEESQFLFQLAKRLKDQTT